MEEAEVAEPMTRSEIHRNAQSLIWGRIEDFRLP
jgi:hypothetical protein